MTVFEIFISLLVVLGFIIALWAVVTGKAIINILEQLLELIKRE